MNEVLAEVLEPILAVACEIVVDLSRADRAAGGTFTGD
jgi:hypothetical protein